MAISARRSVTSAAVVLALSAGLTGCAQQQAAQAAAKHPATSGPDFSIEGEANLAAANAAPDLSRFPSYAGEQIVSYGIEVDLVGPPTPEIQAAVARQVRLYEGKPIPVRYRSVRYSERELQALSARIFADRGSWQKQGIELSAWSIDLATNTLRLDMSHYTDAYRDALIAKYGNRITVTPEDITYYGD